MRLRQPCLREHFLLDPGVTFLNHGSFGACPKSVFARYQAWQLELERQPVDYFDLRLESELETVRQRLGAVVGAAAQDLTLVTNTTTGLNMLAWGLQLPPGAEVLSTDLEYGAVDLMWGYLAERFGFTFRRHPVGLPAGDAQAWLDAFWAGVGPHTRVICISHITSQTALVLPIAELCREAARRGLLTLIDGAHGPGQVDLQLDELGCDAYVGNLHKWMCAPKGAAFIYLRPEHQARFQPLVVGWALDPSKAPDTPHWVRLAQMQGTRDLAAWLAVPDALDFCATNHGAERRQELTAMAAQAQAYLQERLGTAPLHPPGWTAQMASVELPGHWPGRLLKSWLRQECNLEVPITYWSGRPLLRVSCQSYNTWADMETLGQALDRFPAERK